MMRRYCSESTKAKCVLGQFHSRPSDAGLRERAEIVAEPGEHRRRHLGVMTDTV